MSIRFRAFLVGLAVFALVVGPSTTVLAELRIETEITYTVDAADSMLRLHSDLRLENRTPDQVQDGQVVRFFYDNLSLPVPAGARNIRVTSGGQALAHTVSPFPNGEGNFARVNLGRQLLFGETMDLRIAFDIPGDPPRSESAFRVNPAYFSMAVSAWGDPGLVTVHVVAPEEFRIIDEDGVLGSATVVDGQSVFTISDISDLDDFFIHLRGVDDSNLRTTRLEVNRAVVEVASWPGDDFWESEVITAVEAGMPELERLIGIGWLPTGPLTILESFEVNLAGFGGWYLREDNEIAIGEWVDPRLVMHELSHTWFNHELFVERWILEGLAEEFSTHAMVNTGLGTDDNVRPLTAPEPTELLSYLTDWVMPTEATTVGTREERRVYEAYGYETSWWVVQATVDEIGIEAMAEVVRAAYNDEIAYRGPGEPETTHRTNDWRRFLDLLEEVGGSESAVDLFTTFVTATDLTERAEARLRYAGVAASDWTVPIYIRRAMSGWEFEVAQGRLGEAEELLAMRSAIETDLMQLGMSPSDALRVEYEEASDSFSSARQLAREQADALEVVLVARDKLGGDRDLLTRIGLIGQDPEAGFDRLVGYLEADNFRRAGIEADSLISTLEGAPQTGLQRLVAAAAILVLILVLVLFALRRRRRRTS